MSVHVPATLFALLAATLPGVLSAQAPGPGHRLPPPVRAGIDTVFADLDRTNTPGCAVGVVVDGVLAFADGYGSANLDHEIPITPQTVFYTGSVSKQFTAGAVALAARRGQLSLDDDLRRWFPELPPYASDIRVRHLVHHTSGLRDYLTLQSIAGSFEGTTDEEVIELLARQRALNFPPGDRHLYSNSGYFLMSELVERATGLTLREFAEREFFGPRSMRNTHFHDDPNHVVRHRATGYAPTDDGFRMEHAWSFAQVGSGGVYSNVEDLARWEADFEADRIGPPGFRDALLERGVLNDGDTLDYAFGLARSTLRGLPAIAHGGSLAGFRAHVLRLPTEGTAVVVLCNVTNANPGARAVAVAERVLGDRMDPPDPVPADAGGAREGPPPPVLSAAELGAYAGAYHAPEIGAAFELRVEGGRLEVRREVGGTLLLRPEAPDVFAAGGLRLRFERDGGGRVVGFVLDAGRANGIVFERSGG